MTRVILGGLLRTKCLGDISCGFHVATLSKRPTAHPSFRLYINSVRIVTFNPSLTSSPECIRLLC